MWQRMFGRVKDGTTVDERELRGVELQNTYIPPDIIRMVKSNRMKCLGHVVRMGEESSA
jgi:hypothetical protein